MKIGIISKPDHCKSHVKALAADGYEMVSLGGDVSSIPPTIDVLVVRTQSCSHGSTDTALAWARTTSKPLVVHNGLSSIRRELRRIKPMEAPAVDFEKALKILKRDRPNDPTSVYRGTLLAMGATPQILRELLPTEPTDLGAWGVDFPQTIPENTEWSQCLPLERLSREFEATKEIYNQASSKTLENIRDTFLKALADNAQTGLFPALGDDPILPLLKGRPIRFLLVLLRLIPDDIHPTKTALNQAYFELTGKNTDVRISAGVAWSLGKTLGIGKPFLRREPIAPVSATLAPASSTEQQPESELLVCIPDKPAPVPPHAAHSFEEKLQLLRRENEEYILELMNSISELKRDNKFLLEAVSELRLQLKERAHEPSAPVQGDSVLDLLDLLKKRGAKVTIEM